MNDDDKSEDKMLATALRDLCGLRQDMIVVWPRLDGREWRVADTEPASAESVQLHDRHGRWANSPAHMLFPVLDAPANWGAWLAWMQQEVGQRPPWLDFDDALPYELLGWYVELTDRHRQQGIVPTTASPPSVTAWWQAQQEGGA